MLKTKKFRSEKYRRWIASLPCVISGSNEVQCAHIRSGTDGGLSMKPSDFWCIPLSVREHARQGEIGERLFWGERLEAAKALARSLHDNAFNTEKALQLIDQFRWNTLGQR